MCRKGKKTEPRNWIRDPIALRFFLSFKGFRNGKAAHGVTLGAAPALLSFRQTNNPTEVHNL